MKSVSFPRALVVDNSLWFPLGELILLLADSSQASKDC